MGGSHWLPFLFVGVAYFIVAVVVTAGLLIWRGEPGNWNTGGVIWSFMAGVVTAVGALCIILALTNKGNPIYVMPLVFGGAPVVNTLVTMWTSKTHREAGPFFYAGLILVIAGAVTVLVFNPASRAKPAPAAVEAAADAQGAASTAAATSITFPQLLKVLGFVALTALCWGCYGPLLHIGQMKMHGSRMRPFICVGLAYVVVAIVGPLTVWTALGADGELSARGVLEPGWRNFRGAGVAGSDPGFHFRRQAGLCDAAGVRRGAGGQYFHQHRNDRKLRGHFAVLLCRADRRRGRRGERAGVCAARWAASGGDRSTGGAVT